MKFSTLFALVAVTVCLFFCTNAQAGYLLSWDATPTMSDPVDNALTAGRDIYNGVWVDSDTNYWYFRMDLRDAPSVVGNSYSGLYGIYIDAIDGVGGSHGDTDYIPTGLTGIDYIIDSHFNNSGTGTWEDNHYHYGWNGAGFQIGAVDETQQTENGGKTLEWKIARSKIGDEFTFWAATHDVGSSAPTYDLAPNAGLPGITVSIPEPSTLLLLVAGMMAMLIRRK